MITRLTRQQAINANCRDCICDTAVPGTWKMQVEACTITKCALYPYRPVSESLRERPQSRNETI